MSNDEIEKLFERVKVAITVAVEKIERVVEQINNAIDNMIRSYCEENLKLWLSTCKKPPNEHMLYLALHLCREIRCKNICHIMLWLLKEN